MNEDTTLTGSVLTGTTSVDGPVTVTGFSIAGDATAYSAGQTASIAGDWGALRDSDMLATVALQTRYGQAWMPRVFGAVLALAVVLWVRPGRPWVLAWVAALGLAPLSLGGHAAMHEGWLGVAHAVNDALHGLSAAFWLGSLPVFLFLSLIHI